MLHQMAWLFILHYICGLLVLWTDSLPVIFEMNSTIPVKSSSLAISCRQSEPFTSSSISFKIGNTGATVVCAAYNYGCDFYKDGYSFTANMTGAFAVINSLDRMSDQLIWTCEYNASQSTRSVLNITVYTIPTGLSITQEPNTTVDLSATSVKMQCKTSSCTYPMALVHWHYQDQATAATPVLFTTTNSSGTLESCQDQEQIYTSTLVIPMYTTLSDNSDMTVTFTCRIVYLDPFINIMAKAQHTVRFAVRVTEAVLQKNGQNITDTLIVTSGEFVTLTCMIATSRPTPTIDWYLGSQKKGTGASLTFTPSDMDHNKTIYCQAYNIDVSRTVFSLKPSLFVQVRVKEAVLQHNNQNITDTLNVISGEAVTLTCVTTTSRPSPTIEWYLGSEKKGSGASLTFTPSNADHNKTIYCQAYNINPFQLVSSLKPRLFVQVKVSEVTLTGWGSETILFYEGYIQTLQCISSPSRPIASIRWWLGNRQLTNNITNTDTTNNSGLYMLTSLASLNLTRDNINHTIYCDGYISDQMTPAVSRQHNIDVWYQPSKPQVKEYDAFPWLENQTGILQCNSSVFGNPPSSVRWKSDIYITGTNGQLVIQKLVPSDNEKEISCQLVNNYTIDKNVTIVSKSVTLRVEYRPVITFNISSLLTVNETQTISGLCSASGNPNPDPPRWTEKPADSILRFDNISRTDTGTYTCLATANSSRYGKLESQKQLDIIVHFAPDVIVTVTGPTHQNMTLTVLCEAKGLPAEYMFHPWKQKWGDMVIRSSLNGTVGSNNNRLKLETLSLQDMGTYICSVDNNIRGIDGNLIQAGDVDIKVTGRPTVLKEEEDHFTGKSGDSVNIAIPFYSDPAIGSFIFQKNGTELENSSKITMNLSTSVIESKFYGIPVRLQAEMANLFIQNLAEDDFDNYTLVLWNLLGKKEFRLQLHSAGPPLVIDIFYFSRFIDNQIELHFKPGFNGGRVQTFVIEYKSTASPDLPWKNSSVTTRKEAQISNGIYHVNVTQPPPGTYVYRMYSWNEIGRGPYSLEITVFIPEVNKPQPHELNVAPIAGSIGGAVVVIAVFAVIIILRKKRNKSDVGLKDNPLYETSGPKFGPSASEGAVVAEYAAVVKPKKKAFIVEDPNNLYAQVDKTNKTGKKGAAKGKQAKMSRGDIYQNIDMGVTSTNAVSKYENSMQTKIEASDENVYENPGAAASNHPQVNKDGLLYADIMLDYPTTKNGKVVILGLENRTEYAEIAYGKRGQPMLDNDKEKVDGDEEIKIDE